MKWSYSFCVQKSTSTTRVEKSKLPDDEAKSSVIWFTISKHKSSSSVISAPHQEYQRGKKPILDAIFPHIKNRRLREPSKLHSISINSIQIFSSVCQQHDRVSESSSKSTSSRDEILGRLSCSHRVHFYILTVTICLSYPRTGVATAKNGSRQTRATGRNWKCSSVNRRGETSRLDINKHSYYKESNEITTREHVHSFKRPELDCLQCSSDETLFVV